LNPSLSILARPLYLFHHFVAFTRDKKLDRGAPSENNRAGERVNYTSTTTRVSIYWMKAAHFSAMPVRSFQEGDMARPKNLSLLSIEALFKLRDDVAAALGRKADALRKEIASLGSDYAEVGRIAIYGKKKSLQGRKVPIKYRDKSGNTWAGRGAQPRWLTAAIKAGAKRDDFLVEKSAAKPRRKYRRRKK
jgi:DNA-binding protein H-NS